MPLSGCGDFPSPCAVAGHAPERAPGLATSRTLLGLASSFCKLGLAALVPESSQPELEHAATNCVCHLAGSDIPPSLGQVTTPERPGKPRGSSRMP